MDDNGLQTPASTIPGSNAPVSKIDEALDTLPPVPPVPPVQIGAVGVAVQVAISVAHPASEGVAVH